MFSFRVRNTSVTSLSNVHSTHPSDYLITCWWLQNESDNQYIWSAAPEKWSSEQNLFLLMPGAWWWIMVNGVEYHRRRNLISIMCLRASNLPAPVKQRLIGPEALQVQLTGNPGVFLWSLLQDLAELPTHLSHQQVCAVTWLEVLSYVSHLNIESGGLSSFRSKPGWHAFIWPITSPNISLLLVWFLSG